MSRGNTAFLFRAIYPAKIRRKADGFRGLCVELMLNGQVQHFHLQSLSLLSMVIDHVLTITRPTPVSTSLTNPGLTSTQCVARVTGV